MGRVTHRFHAEDSLKEDDGGVAHSVVHADICPARTTYTCNSLSGMLAQTTETECGKDMLT